MTRYLACSGIQRRASSMTLAPPGSSAISGYVRSLNVEATFVSARKSKTASASSSLPAPTRLAAAMQETTPTRTAIFNGEGTSLYFRPRSGRRRRRALPCTSEVNQLLGMNPSDVLRGARCSLSRGRPPLSGRCSTPQIATRGPWRTSPQERAAGVAHEVRLLRVQQSPPLRRPEAGARAPRNAAAAEDAYEAAGRRHSID
jgi:hypothetical protein